MSLEDYNYYGDYRVQARERGKWYSRIVNRDFVEAEVFDSETGDTETREVRVKREVCPTCGGIGTHTNPSVDCGGISGSEFDDDPEFAREYFRGTLDVPCYECNGERVILRPCDSETEFIEYLDELERGLEESLAISLAERRMGC